MKFGGCTVHT